MAVYRPTKPPKPMDVENFLGVNQAVGETQIKLGEAVFMENYRITKNMKPQKRPGKQIYIDCGSGVINGMWYGTIGGSNRLIFACDGNLYERYTDRPSTEYELTELLTAAWLDSDVWNDSGTWSESANPIVKLIGSIGTASKTEFLWFYGKLIIKTMSGFYTYDGTTLASAVYFVPTVAIGLKPDGTGGTLFQESNVLTGQKKANYVGDNTSVLYKLPEQNVDSATATVNGTPTAVTVNTANGTVTFTVAPPTSATVIITWTKASTASPSLVLSHEFMVDYGVDNDTNLFLFGSGTEKNVFRYSYIGEPFYFPTNGFTKVDSDQFSITDIISQYNSLVIFKEKSAHVVNPTPNPTYVDNKGVNPYDYPYRDLNEAVGNVARGGVQLIENNPMSLYGSSMWLWSSATGIEDERNAQIKSDRLKLSLQASDLRTAVTFDYQDQKEYWVSVGGNLYIWNYGNDTMYTYTNMQADQFLSINGNIAIRYGSKIWLVSESYTDDRDADADILIHAIMRLGFTDFSEPSYKKVMRDAWITIAPDSNSSVDITFATNRKLEGELKTYTISTQLLDFDNINFDDFTFDGNTNPKPGYINPKVREFVYLQAILENKQIGETLTVLGLHLGVQLTGLSRR